MNDLGTYIVKLTGTLIDGATKTISFKVKVEIPFNEPPYFDTPL